MDDSPSVIADRTLGRQAEFYSSIRDDFLDLIILPTEQCNFRCTYCYEDFTVGRMPRAVIDGIECLIAKRAPGLRLLFISWFGGEPLLASDIVEEVSDYASALSDVHPKLEFKSGMTTNGYQLNLARARRLRRSGVTHYQISLDGPEEQHNTTRVRRNGGETYGRIAQNLTEIRDSDLDVSILLRVHLTPENIHYMPAFVSMLSDQYLSDARFEILPKAIGKWGGPNDSEMSVLSDTAERDALEQLRTILQHYNRDGQLFEPPATCYAARANSLLIRANGHIGKCTVALQDPANYLGKITTDGCIEVDDGKLRPWLRGWASGIDEELSCPLVGLPRENSPTLLQIGVRPT